MTDFNNILAKNLNCNPTEIVDKLFPKEMGYTEDQRFYLMNSIFMSMNDLLGYNSINASHLRYICVDFDGTIVEHTYPNIGKPVPGAIETLNELKSLHNIKIILLTMRGHRPYEDQQPIENPKPGQEYETKIVQRDCLQEAIDYCAKNGLQFDYVNENPEQISWTDSNKVYAPLYIDDAAAGCPLINVPSGRPYVNWEIIRNILGLDPLKK